MGNKKTLRDRASGLADSLAPHVENARDKAGPVLADARDKAVPLVADARDRFTSDVLPLINAALASLDEATEDARHETAKRSKAVAAALKGEIAVPEPKRKRRLRGPLALMLVGLGGIGFAVARRLGNRQPTTTWQSSYTPPAPTSPSTAPAAPAAAAGSSTGLLTNDIAASDPAEAASDATDVPHATTTPETPVEEIQVDKKPST